MSTEDDPICSQCGGELDTGFECTECGHDMYEEVHGAPFNSFGVDEEDDATGDDHDPD